MVLWCQTPLQTKKKYDMHIHNFYLLFLQLCMKVNDIHEHNLNIPVPTHRVMNVLSFLLTEKVIIICSVILVVRV